MIVVADKWCRECFWTPFKDRAVGPCYSPGIFGTLSARVSKCAIGGKDRRITHVAAGFSGFQDCCFRGSVRSACSGFPDHALDVLKRFQRQVEEWMKRDARCERARCLMFYLVNARGLLNASEKININQHFQWHDGIPLGFLWVTNM